MVPANPSGKVQARKPVPRKSGAVVRLTRVQQDACDVLAICASSRASYCSDGRLYTWSIAARVDRVASDAFNVADQMLDESAPLEHVYALAECLIRTGEVR